MKIKYHLVFIVCLVLLLAGCGKSTQTAVPPTATEPPLAATETEEPPSPTTAPPTATETEAPPTPTTAPPTATPEPEIPALPPDAQRIEFQAEDGAALVGYYYPAAINPAPVIVLMHWAGGDQTDWLYVGLVSWLQNRGAEIPTPSDVKPFDTPYPFPPLAEGQSYAVFTFDFRSFGESPGEGSSTGWIMDAAAAYQTAANLPGVDPARVVGIGGSIGADGVADATPPTGALSLSPGNWLDMAYADAVKVADDLDLPIWCVAAEDDPTAVNTCNAAQGEKYQKNIYPKGGHAMVLFKVSNELDPPIEKVILDFLDEVVPLP